MSNAIFGNEHHKVVRQFWVQKKASHAGILRFFACNLLFSLRTLFAFIRLPQIEVQLSASENGRLIKSYLRRIVYCKVIRLNAIGVCFLEIPQPPVKYDEGSRRQTFRRKVRSALKAQVTWRHVDDSNEQRKLITQLDEALANKKRYTQVDSDHSYLVGRGLWTVAFARDGTPILIAVTIHDNECALLQAFLTTGDGPVFSDTRYLLFQVIVDRLATLGVRYLFDGRSPHQMPVGLWQFQQMLGFQIAIVRVRQIGNAQVVI